MHLSEPIWHSNKNEWFTTRLYHCRNVGVFQIVQQWVLTYFLEILFIYQTQWQYAETRLQKCNLNASLRTIGVISPNQMRKSLSISPNHHSQYIACRLLWITGSICNYVHSYMDLGAFTSNSQDLKKYVCLVNVQSLIYWVQSRDCLVYLHIWFGWKSTTCEYV